MAPAASDAPATGRRLAPLHVAQGIAALYAATFGFVSTDSWNYLAIARSLKTGSGCAIDGAYYAVFPCGYPALIALVSWSTDMAALIAASKLVNLVLWIAAAALVQAYARHWAATLVFALNPVSLLLLFATWSESLMLLAVAGALYAVRRSVDHPDERWRNAALLALFLMVGCAARYAFGPFAVLLALAVALCHGRHVFARSLPGFIAAAGFLAAYLAFNLRHTGFATGVPRPFATEPATTLLDHFFGFLGHQLVDFGGLILLVGLAVLLARRAWPIAWRPTPEAMLLVVVGLLYLALAFLARYAVLFDPYGPRTVGPGVVLLAAGVAALILPRDPGGPWTAAAAALAALVYAFLLAIGLRDLSAQARYAVERRAVPGRSIADAIAAYRSPNLPDDARTIVSFGIPPFPPALRMAANVRLYYPAAVALVGPPAGRDFPRMETTETFSRRLGQSGAGAGCYFDFSMFKSVAALRQHFEREFDPDLARRLASVARPGRFVPCAAFLRAGALQ